MKKQRGFTLIEILIALAVFAILATLTSSAMYYAFNIRARITEQADRLNSLQLAITGIERDITQAVKRDVRGNEMHIFPAFLGESQYLELTRGGLVNPNDEGKRSTLQRIALLCRDTQLLRRSWKTLDTIDRNDYEDRVLLKDLESCQFAYLNHNLQILPGWRANAVQQNQRAEPLPQAIQFNVTLNHQSKMSFLFIIPGALYAEK